jgi:formiminotetrahydrofolate cyclodeaminase
MESFLASLAEPHPNPGGGAASAYAATVALALLEKIVRLESRRHEAPIESGPGWQALLDRVTRLADACTRLREEDGAAYLKWAEAKASIEPPEAVQDALREAICCPIAIAERIQEAFECVIEAGRSAGKHLLSDLLVVCEVLNGAGRGTLHIATANLRLVTDASGRMAYERQTARLQNLGNQSYNRATEELLNRMNASRQVESGHD